MKKTAQVLSLTLALFLTYGAMAGQPCKSNAERVEVYAHPSLMNADATEVKDANNVYRIGGKILKQKNRLGFINKDNVYVNAWSRDLLKSISAKKGDRNFDIKMPISRGELAYMLANGLNMEQMDTTKSYTDVTNKYWATEEISKTTAADVMIGYPDKSFKPDQAITKAEVFATIAKLIDVPYTNDGSAPRLNGKLIENIPTWAYGCTKEVVASGLIDNLPDQKALFVEAYLSRQQVANLVSELRLKYGVNGQLVGDAFANAGIPVAVKVKMIDRVDAKHSNIGDRFIAKTTEEVTFKGETFPKGSTLIGEVVTVQRPGVNKDPDIHNNLGGITVRFVKIKNGKSEAELPKELTSASVDKINNPNFFARLIGLPFTIAAREVGIVGRTASQFTTISGNGLEEYGDRLADATVETLTGHLGRGIASFGTSFVTLGKGVYAVCKNAITGTFGVVYELGDELLYTIYPSASNSAALNPNEEFTVIF